MATVCKIEKYLDKNLSSKICKNWKHTIEVKTLYGKLVMFTKQYWVIKYAITA